MGARPRRQQPWPVRLTHWLNVILLVILAGSGLQIFVAFPALGPRGDLYRWYPWPGTPPPPGLRLGGWLAGARHWHFAFAWLFVANGLVYLVYLLASGEFRRRILPELRHAVQTLAHYLRLRRQPPPPRFYNGLQRLAYAGTLLVALVEVLSGLALYKPVQLPWLTALFGGYDAARAVHLLGLVALALFTLIHIILVCTHPLTIPPMFTGGRTETKEEP
jgi:thiosulfate reductase cytochrome b subunit